MIVVDTTVLAYAVGADHPLRDPCRRLLVTHGDGQIVLTTTVEVVQEFAHVRARRRSRADAVALARQFAGAFSLLVTDLADLDLGLTLYHRNPEIGMFDAVLAAVALNRHAEALVSADQAFRTVSSLPWTDPATSDLDHLLGR